MPNSYNTLRQRVLEDLDISESDIKNIKLGVPSNTLDSGPDLIEGEDTSSLTPDNSEDFSEGVDYFSIPIGPEQFSDGNSRFAVMDNFLQFIVSQVVFGLRVTPTFDSDLIATFILRVRETGNHPVIYNGKPFVYSGASIDLTPYAPASGTTEKVLLAIDPTTVTIDSIPSDAIKVYTSVDFSPVDNVNNWPENVVPCALVTLHSLDFGGGINFDDIEDVRPFINWGNNIVFDEKLWFSETIAGVTDYYFDSTSYPAIPFNKNCRLSRNGQILTYGESYDYTIEFDSIQSKYYVHLNFNTISTGERLKAWFVKA